MSRPRGPRFIIAALLALFVSCLAIEFERRPRHGWWAGLGPVLPHDSFPADCRLCHQPESWRDLVADFAFDHGAETGVELNGAHDTAQCLRCHNDRGPVEVFANLGCVGCHQDVHLGQLGDRCTQCHTEQTWRPFGQVQQHDRTRFPLLGTHASVSCRRCHPGAEVGIFLPQDIECVSCHASDLARAQLPDHQAFGFVDRCDSCHKPTFWNDAQLDPDFGTAQLAPTAPQVDPHAGLLPPGHPTLEGSGGFGRSLGVHSPRAAAPGPLSAAQVLSIARR